MFVNSCGDGTDLEVYTCHKDYCTTLMGRRATDKLQQVQINFNMNQKLLTRDERLLKQQLLNRDQEDILRTLCNDPYEQTIFRNSEYKSVMYTFSLVRFALSEEERTQKKRQEEKELLAGPHRDGEGSEAAGYESYGGGSSDYGSESGGEEEAEEARRTAAENAEKADNQPWPHDNIARDYCKMPAKQMEDGCIYIEDRRPDGKYRGRIKRVQILPLNVPLAEGEKKRPLCAYTYYQSEENYVFLFWYDYRHWFFLRKKITEIFELDQDADIKDQALVTDRTPV